MVRYCTLLLPKTLSPLLARRFAALNVEAVRAIHGPSVSIFQYAPQFTRTVKSWEDELSQPDYNCYVLVAANPETGAFTLEEGQWVGLCVFLGPDAPAFSKGVAIPTEPSEGLETRWLATRLYVNEHHRRLESLRLLHEAIHSHMTHHAMSVYKSNTNQQVRMRLRLSAYYNTIAHQFYASTGAKTIAELKALEDLEYDGFLPEVPEEFLPKQNSPEPITAVMEYAFEVTV